MVSAGDLEMKGITQDEVSKLTKAMKDPAFRDHIDEYTREISDPAHRKEYLEYLAQLEAKGEMPEGQQLLRAQPGCCVKTTILFKNGQTQKCFINIVHSDRLDDISFSKADKGSGQQVKLPYSLGPPRPDRDHRDEYCMTCDFAVSSGTFARATQSAQAPQIMKLLVDTAAEGLASKFLQGHEEVKKDFKIMQRMACKGGQPMPMSVQAELLKDKGSKPTPAKPGTITQDAVTPGELKKMRQDAKKKREPRPEAAEEDEAPQRAKVEVEDSKGPQRIRVPKHRLVHSGSIDLTDFMESSNSGPTAPLTTVPRLLKLTVELPTVKSGGDVSLEVTSYNVVVEVPDKYYLDLPLSFEIDEGKGVAKFDKAKQTLCLELPVVPRLPPPEMLRHAGGAGLVEEADGDGALSEGRGSEDELPPLEEARDATEPAPPDQPPGEPPPAVAPMAPEAPTAPPSELLEVQPGASALRIARPEPERPVAQAPAAVEASAEACEELPAFVPAGAFEGKRQGYYFSTGREGLGYYRDSRQPAPGGAVGGRPRPEAPAAEPEALRGPLVTEVARPPPPAEAPAERGPLPEALQRHVEATASLCHRVPAAPGGAFGGDLPLEWRQTRQNLMFFVDVPTGHEVSDARLRLATQSLTLTFCTRPARPKAEWQRYRLRRTLSLLADPRQWHAQLDRGGGSGGADQLVFVLRKVDRSEMWADAFDAAAACLCVPVRDEPGADPDGGARLGEPAAPAAAAGGASPQPPDAREGAAARAAAEEAAAAEDSAELDAGAALAAPAASAAPQGPAPAALVQSATTMGRGVLLSNRLIYQLL